MVALDVIQVIRLLSEMGMVDTIIPLLMVSMVLRSDMHLLQKLLDMAAVVVLELI